jgi:hypothetical protein
MMVALKRLRESLAKAETEAQLESLNFGEFFEYLTQPAELISQLYNKKSLEFLKREHLGIFLASFFYNVCYFD